MTWRTGRKVGRTIYLQLDPEKPSDNDVLIGVMDQADYAAIVVEAVNEWAADPAAEKETP